MNPPFYEGDRKRYQRGHKEGEKKGRKEGRKEGRDEGEKHKAMEIARNMRALGVDIDVITQATGLTREEVERLSPRQSQRA